MFNVVPLIPRTDNLTYDRARHHPSVQEIVDMDLDEAEDAGSSTITSPGEVLSSSAAVLRGHGTYVDGEEVVSSVAGVLTRVNKLVTVRTLKSRYNPEVGDLVVGRIAEVGPKRWKVDVNGRQDAILMLSSVNLPGGIQRRKLEADELQMRNFFEEGDLLVAEVQSLYTDGSAALHTRSLKFGKLRNGQLATISPQLIRRLKSHFFTLPSCGIDVILGMNGFIWVSKHVKETVVGEEGFDAEAVYSNVNDVIDPSTRSSISRITNIIAALARHLTPITDTILNAAYEWTIERGVDVAELNSNDEVVEEMILEITTV